MKKFIAAILAVAMLTACGSTETETPLVNANDGNQDDFVGLSGEDADNSGDTSERESLVSPSTDGYVFNYNGYDVVLGGFADELLEALGTPQNVFQEESCAFHGIDYMYFYPGVQFNTFSPQPGEPDYILSVVFSDDTVTTAEGIYIGMTGEAIEAVYGTPTEHGDIRMQYIKDGMSLSFIFDNGLLADVTYYYDAAAEFEIVN